MDSFLEQVLTKVWQEPMETRWEFERTRHRSVLKVFCNMLEQAVSVLKVVDSVIGAKCAAAQIVSAK